MNDNTIKIKGQKYHLVLGATLIRDNPEVDWRQVVTQPGTVVVPRAGRPPEFVQVYITVPQAKTLKSALALLEENALAAASRMKRQKTVQQRVSGAAS